MLILVWGIFADKTDAFSVNLIKDDGNFMLHISFRPPPSENKVDSFIFDTGIIIYWLIKKLVNCTTQQQYKGRSLPNVGMA